MSHKAKRESLWHTLPDHVKEASYEYDGFIMSNAVCRSYIPHLINFTVRSDDIFLVTYHKAGTTWATKIIHHILEREDEMHLFKKYVLLENPQKRREMNEEDPPGMYEIINQEASPRLIKTHLPMELLPKEVEEKKPKIVYVARNPKDVAVSFFTFSNFTANCPSYEDWSEFFHDFSRGAVIPGSWFDHVLSWWQRRNEPNVLFLKYEDMKKDLRSSVEQIANFIGRPLNNKTLDDITAKCTFDAMKRDPKTNPDHEVAAFQIGVKQNQSFMRKGQVGDWKTVLTVKQNEDFDSLYQKKMHGTGLKMDFSL